MNLRTVAEVFYPYLLDKKGESLHEFYAVLVGVKAEDKNLEFSWLSLFDLEIHGYGCRFYEYRIKHPIKLLRKDVFKFVLTIR